MGKTETGLESRITKTETPPRAWGRPWANASVPSAIGNTPTSVGKTSGSAVAISTTWKHPHERGEDATDAAVSAATPKHPHERGEDLRTHERQEKAQETPPRAWGRPYAFTACCQKQRNTPTSVGKTLDFTGVDGGLVEIRFVALSVFQSQGACLKFQ